MTKNILLTFYMRTLESGSIDRKIMYPHVTCSYFLYSILFTNPSARAGYITRSIFKWSLTGFNSEFSFS